MEEVTERLAQHVRNSNTTDARCAQKYKNRYGSQEALTEPVTRQNYNTATLIHIITPQMLVHVGAWLISRMEDTERNVFTREQLESQVQTKLRNEGTRWFTFFPKNHPECDAYLETSGYIVKKYYPTLFN